MTDIVSKEGRSRMMSGIRGKNTKPEIIIRSALHGSGFRFRLHNNKLPGKPDLVFRKHKAVIFVHGCFWHGHTCHLFKWPRTRVEFWRSKIGGNQDRDRTTVDFLLEKGWRVGIVWECALKGRTKKPLDDIINQCRNWLISREKVLTIT